MPASDAALRALISNAARHLLEADQHYKGGRYPSATASAVLSIEETGKLSFLALSGKVAKEQRHRMHALIFIAVAKGLSQLPELSKWQSIIKQGKNAAAELTARKQEVAGRHPELAEFLRHVEAGELEDPQERVKAWAEATLAKENRDGTMKSWEPLLKDGLQQIRLKATYVDIGENGEILREPDFNDASGAEFLCGSALMIFSLIALAVKALRPTLDLGETIKAVTTDLTGNELLRQVYKLFTGRSLES